MIGQRHIMLPVFRFHSTFRHVDEELALLCSDQLSPKAVESLKDTRVVAISGGWRHTAAADDAGNLYTWGWNKVCSPDILLHPCNEKRLT